MNVLKKGPTVFYRFLGWSGPQERSFFKAKAFPHWLCLLLLAMGPVYFPILFIGWEHKYYLPFAFSFALWTIWLFAACWLAWRLDVYESVPAGIRLISLLLGICFADSAAEMIAGFVIRDYSFSFQAILISVATEETLKFSSVLLIFFLSPSIFKRPLGSITCGITVGIGFAFLENYNKSLFHIGSPYSDGHTYLSAISFLFTRGMINTPWMHSTYTAISSIFVCFLFQKTQNKTYKFFLALTGLLLAIIFHFSYNYGLLLLLPTQSVYSDIVPFFIVFLPLLILIVWALRKEQAWYTDQVKMLSPQITGDEALILMSRLRRYEERWRIKKRLGARVAAQAYWFQRVQLAYLISFDDAPDSIDTLSLKTTIDAARVIEKTILIKTI